MTSPWHGGVLGMRTARSHNQILTTTRNQGRGVRNHPGDVPTPLKSSRETLFAIELVIGTSELLERSIGDQTFLCHRQTHFYATASSSFFGIQGFD